MSNIFASEFWRSLYFVGMGGQATEADANAMFGLFTGFASFSGTLSAEAVSTQTARRGKDEGRRRLPPVKTYVEWSKQKIRDIARREDELFSALLDKSSEPAALPIAEKKGLDYEAELNRINDLLLKAMAASADDARRKQEQALRSAAKKAKVIPPDTAAETRAMVVWLAKRAEWLREQEAADEEEIEILLLAA
jgi:hypothetical protein